MIRKTIAVLVVFAPGIFSQAYQGQSASTFSVTTKNKEQTVEISNVVYEVTGTGNPLLVLRKSTRTKQVLSDIGEDATTTERTYTVAAHDTVGQRQRAGIVYSAPIISYSSAVRNSDSVDAYRNSSVDA